MRQNKDFTVSIICHILAGSVLLCLFVIGWLYDFQITHALANKDSFFGMFFQKFAEYPQYLVMPICGILIFYNADTFSDKKVQSTIYFLGALLNFIGWFVFCYASEKLYIGVDGFELVIPNLLGFSITLSILMGGIGLIFGKLIPKYIMHKLFKWAVFAIVFSLITFIIISVMKKLWFRMRYRDIIRQPDFEENLSSYFTPWYKLNFATEKIDSRYHYSSFPSGHTSAATHIFLITIFCDIFPALNKKCIRYSLNACCTIFVALTMISRLVNCAHFLTDVTVAVFLTYSIFYFTKSLFFRKNKYAFGNSSYEFNVKLMS